jgi:hypothetical protein
LSLIGNGHSDALKNTFIEGIVLEDNASESYFSGLYVFDEIACQNSISQITNLTFENSIIDVIDFGSSTFYMGVDNVLIRGNIIQSVSGVFTNTIISNNLITFLIFIGSNYQSVSIKNNIFYRGGSGSGKAVTNSANADGSITLQNNIFYYSTSGSDQNPNTPGVIFENCLSYNRGSTSVITLSGNNNLDNQNPLFVEDNDDAVFDALIDDYNLQPGSPAIGTGAGGVDIGLYDNSAFTFNNFGYTNGIPTVKITNITDRIAPGATLSVTINTNAN